MGILEGPLAPPLLLDFLRTNASRVLDDVVGAVPATPQSPGLRPCTSGGSDPLLELCRREKRLAGGLRRRGVECEDGATSFKFVKELWSNNWTNNKVMELWKQRFEFPIRSSKDNCSTLKTQFNIFWKMTFLPVITSITYHPPLARCQSRTPTTCSWAVCNAIANSVSELSPRRPQSCPLAAAPRPPCAHCRSRCCSHCCCCCSTGPGLQSVAVGALALQILLAPVVLAYLPQMVLRSV